MNYTQEEAIKVVSQILIKFDNDIMEAFHKQIRFHNNEITQLKSKIANHKKKVDEMVKKEKEFKWLSQQAKQAGKESQITVTGKGLYDKDQLQF